MKYAQLPTWLCSFCVANTCASDVPMPKFLGGDEGEFDLEKDDGVFASYFDQVIIPATQKRKELDPRLTVSKTNASEVRECVATNKRILDADHRLIIVGGGPAGLSAAVYAARAEMKPLVVARDGGQLESTSWIDNYPGYEEGVDAVELVQRLQKQAARFGAEFMHCDIESVDLGCRPFKVQCKGEDRAMTSSAVVVATGAAAKWLGVPGEQTFLSRGVHTCATCDGFFYKGKHAAVVGGGDTAMEQALFLARMAAKVTVIHRRSEFRASKAMATRVLNHPQIDIVWNTQVLEFVGDIGGDHLTGLRVLGEVSESDLDTDSATDGAMEGASGEEHGDFNTDEEGVDHVAERILEVDGCFVAIGHVPNTQLFAEENPKLRRDDEGYIYTIPGSTVTSITGVYAAGDVADKIYRQAITSAGTGAMAAMDAERWLCEHGC